MTDTETDTVHESLPEFESFQDLPETMQRGIEELGWKEPMPVQRRVIPTMIGSSGEPTSTGRSNRRKILSELAIAACRMLYFSDRSDSGW